jgi:hypothetical protein
MRYGLNVNDTKTLFPLSINAVERTPDGHVQLVIGHSYGPTIGDTIAGRVILGPQEAAVLAEDIVALAEDLATATEPENRDD